MSGKPALVQAVNELSESEADRVLGFIDTLKRERGRPRPGSAEAVLRAAESW
jgi:hypothetical protein